MKRKIIKQGAGTLTISLPSSWTKMFKLKSGDEIDVLQEGKVLLISTEEQFRSKKSELNMRGFSPALVWIHLTNAYIRGDDEIKVLYDDPKILNLLSKATGQFVGLEIIEQGKKSCVLKDLSGTTDISLDMILRRIFLLILSIAGEGREMLENKDIKSLNDVLAERDHDVNKLVSFYLRTLNKKGFGGNFQQTMHHYGIVNFLEHLGDEYSRMFAEIEKPVSRECMKLYNDVVKLTRSLYELFYRHDIKLAEQIREKRDVTKKNTDRLMQKKNLNDIKFLYRIKKIAELIFDIEKLNIGLHI